jgi:regulator of sirC expression with transglutaminase-like and TPR domain
MPTHLEVRPDIADKLAALAKARGVSVDELLQEMLAGLELPQDAIAEPSMKPSGVADGR